MTDPIKALIAAAKNAVAVCNGNGTHREERIAIDALEAALSIAAEARPEPKPMPSEMDFLPPGMAKPSHGMFARPEPEWKRKSAGLPAAEPSDKVAELIDKARGCIARMDAERNFGDPAGRHAVGAGYWLCDAVEALAREVRK